MNNTTWEVDRQRYISVIKKCNQAMDAIYKLSDRDTVISPEDNKLLEKYHKTNNLLLQKLEKKIFEVAIVGLEKAGKSTFSNALIANDILPHATERCTYTSTQLEYGEDWAQVDFYSRKDFNKNFSDMLSLLKYNNAENIYFDTLPLDEFTRYFDKLSQIDPLLYEYHRGRTEEDIIDIINGRAQLAQYLDKPSRIFKGDEVTSEEFKSFITDHIKSRAVEKVSIKSSKLKDLENIVLYDVPGFDSPTSIHKEQTLEKFKVADAIILITNIAENPDLQGTQLNVLTHESDMDGVKLNEKLFVYGNKIDKANTAAIADHNIDIFWKSVVGKYRLVKDKHFFYGSAYAYLEANGILPNIGSNDRLLSFDKTDGIKEIKDALKSYYEVDRFEVLKKRIIRNIQNIKEILKKIIDESEDLYNIDDINSESYKTLLTFTSKCNKELEEKLSRLRDDLKNDITSGKYFTENLNDIILSNFPHIDADKVESARLRVSVTPTPEFPGGLVNKELRKDMHKQYMDIFTNTILKIANDKANEIDVSIINTFYEALSISADCPNPEEIKQAVETLIEKITYEVSFDQRSFVQLIERFSRDLFDVLLLYPLSDSDRLGKFLAAREDFYSLAMYYDGKDSSLPYYMQPLVSMILTHQEENTEAIEGELLKVLGAIPGCGSLFKQGDKGLKKTAEIVAKNPQQKDAIIRAIVNHLQDEEPQTLEAAHKCIGQVILRFASGPTNWPDEDTYIKMLIDKLPKTENTAEGILEEINQDIDYLKRLLVNAVLKAISLEKPFASTITKKITRIINVREGEDFAGFYASYAKKILYREFSNTEFKRAAYENRKAVLEKLKEISAEIEL